MSKLTFSEELERDFFDEKFMEDAAKLIDLDLLEDAGLAQKAEIDEAWLSRVEESVSNHVAKKNRKQKFVNQVRHQLKSVAILVISLFFMFSAIYTTVDAARETINNFMTGKTHRRATVVYPENVPGKTYSLIPEGWRGPVYATWMPDGYIHANSGTQLDRYWWLCYTNSNDIMKSISIFVWDETYAPSIDIEGCILIKEHEIQNVPVKIYEDTKWNRCMLIMVKNDLTIQIVGDVNQHEITDIAEGLVF